MSLDPYYSNTKDGLIDISDRVETLSKEVGVGAATDDPYSIGKAIYIYYILSKDLDQVTRRLPSSRLFAMSYVSRDSAQSDLINISSEFMKLFSPGTYTPYVLPPTFLKYSGGSNSFTAMSIYDKRTDGYIQKRDDEYFCVRGDGSRKKVQYSKGNIYPYINGNDLHMSIHFLSKSGAVVPILYTPKRNVDQQKENIDFFKESLMMILYSLKGDVRSVNEFVDAYRFKQNEFTNAVNNNGKKRYT